MADAAQLLVLLLCFAAFCASLRLYIRLLKQRNRDQVKGRGNDI